MTKLLIRKWIKNYTQVKDKKVREQYGILSGVLGILCNLLLFAVKLVIGMSMQSIAIISDAMNNLSDLGSCFVTVIGVKMSNRLPDKEHPFGHGRIEYLSSLIVSIVIMLVGFELFKGAFTKILHPAEIQFQPVLMIILAVSLLVKFWMFRYNRYIGDAIDSGLQRAAAADSLNDVWATSAVIAATLIGHFTGLRVDGYIGLAVSLLVLYTGFQIARQTVDLLLGQSPDPETVAEIERVVLAGDGVVGVHDLIVHDYGPGRVLASLHAEVPDTIDIVRIHEVIDQLETQVFENLGIHLVIHMDPICVNCEKTNQLRDQVAEVCHGVHPLLSIHDFRITDGENQINLIFDLVIPSEIPAKEREQIPAHVMERIAATDSRYRAKITVDHGY